ncbi:MAG: hypothetical protein FRX49_02983, partial [Trebouxia sp. A1-2]
MYRFEVYVRSVTVKSSNLPFWEIGDTGSATKLLSGAVAVKLLQYPLLTLLPATLTGKQVKGCKPICLETTFSLHSGKSCTFTAERESLCDKLAQAPLCLLFLGPSAKGGPGLLGVATLQLVLENADPHPNPSSKDSCCQRVHPLPLISPVGIEIGYITAAARIFCCMPMNSKPQLITRRTNSANDSATSDAGSTTINSEHSKSESDKDQQAEEFAATPLAGAKAAAADVSKVSAAVQTDTPQPEIRTESLTDTDSGRHVHQVSVGLQAKKQGARAFQTKVPSKAAPHEANVKAEAAEQPVYVQRPSSNAEGHNLTDSEGSKSGKIGQVRGSKRDVIAGGSDRKAMPTQQQTSDAQQQASDAQQQILPSLATAEAGNVSEPSNEQVLAWGRSGLSKGAVLMRLQEALADVEQLKADLLMTEDSARQPAQPTTAPKKKRKAQSMIQHPALRHGQGRASKLKANVALTRGDGGSAVGGALTQDKPSSTVPVHQPASRAESQAELDVDRSSRPEEHRAVRSSPHISQKRQTHPRRQQGPLPGSPIAILARQQLLTANARRQSHMSHCNSSVADPAVIHSSYTDQRWDSEQASSQHLPDESSAALETSQQDDKQSDTEGIFPADKTAVTYMTADLSDGDSATVNPADPGVAHSASTDLAEPAHQVAAYPVQTSDAGGYLFMSRGDQRVDEASSVAHQGPEAVTASEGVPQTKAEAAGLPSIRAIIHDAAASVAEASQAAGTCHSASTAEGEKQGIGADAELGSRKHSMQPPNDMPQKLTAFVPSNSSAGVAMQYPWMDPSDQQGSRDLSPQQGLGALAEDAPGVHVTFATNVLPSARHQGKKIPLRHLAAAAADKASFPSPALTQEEAWVVSSAPEQAGVALKPDAEHGQSQHRSLAEHPGTAATAATFHSHGSAEGIKPLDWQQQQQQQQSSQEYSSRLDAAAHQGDGSMPRNSDTGDANERADAVSVASFANSAAKGVNLKHTASEVSEEAYSDVFEEDMPQPAADDDVSDATS